MREDYGLVIAGRVPLAGLSTRLGPVLARMLKPAARPRRLQVSSLRD